MQFLLDIARLGLKPTSSAPALARMTRRAEEGSPPALSCTVWAERLATKEEVLRIIDELDALKFPDWQMLSRLYDG